MKMRTRTQEMKYGQALGYAWGRKDGTSPSDPNYMFVLTFDVLSFASWYALQGCTLEKGFNIFLDLTMEAQKERGKECMRRPWSMYEELDSSSTK